MERPLTLKPLSIRDENSVIHRKKATADGKSKTSRQVAKKGGVALESRKALNDITNKSSIHIEASSQKKRSENKKCNIVEDGHSNHHVFEAGALSKKKISENEKLNIAEEGFLHDHNKCIDAQKEALQLNFWDTVLPGHGSSDLKVEGAKGDDADIDMHWHPKLEELSMSEFSDYFKSCWKSPPLSPMHWDSPPLPSPFAWELEPLELMLNQDESNDL